MVYLKKKETRVYNPCLFLYVCEKKSHIFPEYDKCGMKERRDKAVKILMKAARVNKNMSLSDMSAALGVSKSTVCRWEKGQLPVPEDIFMRYCSVCDVDTENVIANVKRKEEMI